MQSSIATKILPSIRGDLVIGIEVKLVCVCFLHALLSMINHGTRSVKSLGSSHDASSRKGGE